VVADDKDEASAAQ